VVDIPSVLPSARTDIPNSVYKTTRGKSNAALQELLAVRRSGRPVLVGTTSVESSRAFSDKLTELEIPHELLSADPLAAQREAEVVAQAGRAGAITISTNMAGRGTDILLGGNPAYMARLYLRSALATAAGLPIVEPRDGFYPSAVTPDTVAAVDRAASRFAASRSAAAAEAAAGGKRPPATDAARAREELGVLDELLAVAGSSAAVFENSLEDETREALDGVAEQFEEALATEKARVLQAGGLHVIGTNLHDSRRIDGQLRGRAGRQGDPGSTHFFLSLEDRIFRLFGGDKIKGMLDFLRIGEDTPLESGQVGAGRKAGDCKPLRR
jgi:preprotein translocase subunit SecA